MTIGHYRWKYSYTQSFLSFFRLHNESVNVWSHSFGVLLVLYMIFSTLSMPDLHAEDKTLITIFLLLALYTLVFSTLFHLHLCVKDEKTCRFWSCLDHSGISASIAGGSISVVYLLLHCAGIMRTVWVILLIFVNLVGIFGPMYPFWTTPEFRIYRSLIYLASGAFSFGPFLYYLLSSGVKSLPNTENNFALGYLGLMVSMYTVGGVIYAARIPERFCPGMFDLFGSSHQIWHFFVLGGTFTLWKAILGLARWRLDDLNQCSK